MYRTNLFYQHQNPLKYTMPFGKLIVKDRSKSEDEEFKVPIVLNKDGSMQTTWEYYGPDLEASIPTELAILTEQLQRLFMNLDTGFVLYFESVRHESAAYRTDTNFEDVLTQEIDYERQRMFSSGEFFESNFYCTLYYLPQTDIEDRMQEMMIEGKQHKSVDIDDAVEMFFDVADSLISTMNQLGIPAAYLDADEMVSYLHSTVSDNIRPLQAPQKPMLLDAVLYDSPLYGGLAPRLGRKHMRVIAPIKYSDGTRFGLFDALNKLNFPYRWVSRFYALSKIDSIDRVEHKSKQWRSKIKGFMAMLKEIQSGVETEKDDDENAKMYFNQTKEVMTAIASDYTRYGYYSTSIVIMDEDESRVEEKAKLIIQQLQLLGIKAKSEGMNAVDAWMGSIPGNVGHMIRRPMVSTGNLVHMIPLSNIWPGEAYNKHLDGPSLIYTRTEGSTPFRLNLHMGDVGHSMLVGMTGGGKSVHLNLIEAQFRKYEKARVFIFDKGSSSIALTLGVGGKFYDLGSENANIGLSFQPLKNCDNPVERDWLVNWIQDFLITQNVEITPEKTAKILGGLKTVASFKNKNLRRMSALVNAINDTDLKKQLRLLTANGSYGRYFDSDHEDLNFSSWQSFEMEKIMNDKRIVSSILMYIFHRIEQSLDGSPTLIVLDECWVFFQNKQFANKITEWLRVLRKYNASVLFATQELATITESEIFSAVNTNCDVKIFLPNRAAITDELKDTYHKFGINDHQLEILTKQAMLKKHYYYKSSKGARLYELSLENCPITLAYVAVNAQDVIKAKKILASLPREQFNSRYFNQKWLDYKGIIPVVEVDKKNKIS